MAGSGSSPRRQGDRVRAGHPETIWASTSLWLPSFASSPNSAYCARRGPFLRFRLWCAEQGHHAARVWRKGAQNWEPDSLHSNPRSTGYELYGLGQAASLQISFFIFKGDDTFYSVGLPRSLSIRFQQYLAYKAIYLCNSIQLFFVK